MKKTDNIIKLDNSFTKEEVWKQWSHSGIGYTPEQEVELYKRMQNLGREMAEIKVNIPGLNQRQQYEAEQKLRSMMKDLEVLQQEQELQCGVMIPKEAKKFKSWEPSQYWKKA